MSILSRYILRELLKVMLLTCGVLVTVIAFGAAIRPLAQNLLGPFDTIKYVALAAVPMLQFALPFSAGFAATLVFHRLASDNEILAMSVNGLSYRRILRPAAVLAGAVGLMMLLLVFSVVPRFWLLMRATIARDVTRVFVSTIEDGRAFAVGDLQIYADEVAEAAPPGEQPADGIAPSSRLVLAGVAAVQFDGAGQPETEFTAEYATVDVYRTAQGAFLKPALVNATVFRASDGALVYLPQAAPDAAQVAKRLLAEPKFMTLGELLRLRRELDQYPPVAERRRGLAAVIREAESWRAIDAALRRGEEVVFVDTVRPREYHVAAARVEGDVLVPGADGLVVVTELLEGRRSRQATASRAELVVHHDDGAVTFDLALPEARVRAVPGPRSGSGEAAGRWPARLAGLRLAPSSAPAPGSGQASDEASGEPSNGPSPAQGVAEDLERWPRERLVAEAEGVGAGPGPTARLEQQARSWIAALADEVEKARREVVARVTQRAALSVSAMLLLMLGAVLAIWRRDSVPLEIYVLAFVPAIANILLISGGEQMLKAGRMLPGMAVAWSGNALLAVLVAWAWRRMDRH